MRRRCSSHWRLAVAVFVVLASPGPLGSTASAAALGILHAKPRLVQPGGTVIVIGKGYSSSPGSSNIEIRLDGRQGPIIASISPRPTIGNYQTTSGHAVGGEPVIIPAGTSLGVHTLVATQYNSLGNMVSGLPGRASIEVVASAGAAGQSLAGASAPDDAAPASSWLGSLRPAGRDRVAAVLALLSLVALPLAFVARNRHGARRRTAHVAA